MKRIRILVALGALGLGNVLAAAEVDQLRHVTLAHLKPTEAVKALSFEVAKMHSTAELFANDTTHQIILKAPRPVAAALEQYARTLDEKAALPKGALLMEFAVVEREADGSKHVVAAPRVMSRPGEDASVKVSGDDRGMELKIKQKKLSGGRIQLGVDCESWRRVQDSAGKSTIKSRKVRSKVVVAEGKRVTLESPGDHRMTLELQVHAM